MRTTATNFGADTALPWWHRLGTGLREQWIFAALLVLVWCGDTLLAARYDGRELIAVPGSTLMVVLALLAWRYPVYSGLCAAVAMGLSTAVFALTGVEAYSIGLNGVLPAENVAGLLLVLYVFWKRPPSRAIPVTAALVLACLTAIVVRDGDPILYESASIERSVGLGLVQLVLAIGTGMYLRGRRSSAADTVIQALLRRQWPVIAVLFVFLFVELMTVADQLPSGLIVLVGCTVMAVLAVLAPMRPLEAAMLGAFALVLMALVMRVLHIPSYPFLLGTVPVTAVASGMLLTAFTTRYANPRPAAWTVAALTASAIFALYAIPSEDPDGSSGTFAPVLMGGLLLVVSVGTGMYFRARDQERAQAVQAAVGSAQQTERMALARELHDIVAHHVTGIVVQAQAAQVVAQTNPTAVTDALDRIATSGTEALIAMRRLVASMRGAEPAGASPATEQATTDLHADLTALVAGAQRRAPDHHAPHIELSTDLAREIPPEIARSALRVVQESLTNTEKHATHATHIQVSVHTTGRHLHLRITDDGSTQPAPPAGGSGGYGLIGMRERIELLGGRFNAGPGDHIGWRVEAWLPLGDEQEDTP